MLKCIFFFSLCLLAGVARADNGYRLWLRYDPLPNKQVVAGYRAMTREIVSTGNNLILQAAIGELQAGIRGMLGQQAGVVTAPGADGAIILGTSDAPQIQALKLAALPALGQEGYLLTSRMTGGKKSLVIAANAETGLLYGVFRLLRLLQEQQSLTGLFLIDSPKTNLRILDHWDNLDRTIERGYAGFSLWNWHTLPGIIEQRYIDYARANASIGINGTVLTNVNANAAVLTKEYLLKVAALANVFRRYGIRVYLTARFSAPIEIGGLKTADPLDEGVKRWWATKIDEIYQLIPDFGGLLVKANSEGQPGPQNYGRNHADGANMLADAIAKHNGIVMWRAFVYSSGTPEDRFKQAYTEFVPLDGKFRKNVLIQVKNGPIDFQPREPFHPLFGAMPKSALAPEFQLTQEYLGFATHLAYLAPLMKECLDADTYTNGKGSTVARMVDGSATGISAMAAVANTGTDINWCGHLFGQANWYAYGRLAWNPALSAGEIAMEWARMTFSNDPTVVKQITTIMLASREAVVNYMTPLGLHHIMGYSHHYGPAPWYNKAPRADWNPVYFHRADSSGLGFDRTEKGSNALAQYAPAIAARYGNLATCPDEFLLWFHHVSWNYTLHSGKSLWNELCLRYQGGVDTVKAMRNTWLSLKGKIDNEQFEQVAGRLKVQEQEAEWWRDACLSYFQTFSRMPLPAGVPAAAHSLEYYESLKFTVL